MSLWPPGDIRLGGSGPDVLGMGWDGWDLGYRFVDLWICGFTDSQPWAEGWPGGLDKKHTGDVAGFVTL